MISNRQLRDFIIKPSLNPLGLYCKDVEELLVATMAHESSGGNYLVKIGASLISPKGGLGIYQMESSTYYTVLSEISKHVGLEKLILETCSFSRLPNSIEMISNLKYSTIIARVNYLRFPLALPSYTDIDSIWQYYKQYWNTANVRLQEKGDSNREDFIKNYYDFIGD